MCTALGQTRLVVLLGDDAFKIARFRPLRFMVRLVLMMFSKDRREHFFEKYGDSFWRAARNDIFAGLFANREEYAYSCNHDDVRVMSTHKQFLWGLVVVQDRGTPVSYYELQQEHPFRYSRSWHEVDILAPNQFCRDRDNKIVLVDYGRAKTVQFLRETAT